MRGYAAFVEGTLQKPRFRGAVNKPWIPASAGMTESHSGPAPAGPGLSVT